MDLSRQTNTSVSQQINFSGESEEHNGATMFLQFYPLLKIHCFYDRFNFMLEILINIFWPIKIKTKGSGMSYYNHIFFHGYHDLIKFL